MQKQKKQKQTSHKISGHDKSLMFINVVWAIVICIVVSSLIISTAMIHMPSEYKLTVRVEADGNVQKIADQVISSQERLVALDRSIVADANLMRGVN